MNPITELRNEHEAVLTALRALWTIADDAGHAKRIRHRGDTIALIEFFRTFLDRCHHGKEEKLLFPLLEAHGVSRDGGPIGVMLSEHDQGRRYVGAIEESIRSEADGPEAAEAFVNDALCFIELLKRHIEKENMVLFPLAARHLSAKQAESLHRGFQRIEAEEIGAGRHEAFHSLLDRLRQDYLGKGTSDTGDLLYRDLRKLGTCRTCPA